MKVLHTSDWHLGASYEGISREEEQRFFLNWLIDALCNHKIDVLIIAGDIFDQPQPSAEAQKIYFQFLFQVSQKTKVKKVIIIGGNHDSPTRLDAPSELLKLLDVFVIGGIEKDLSCLEHYICPVKSDNGTVELVVAAMPFVHEFRLGVRTALSTESEIQQNFKSKISQFYKNLADAAERIACGAPLMATGHLACVGSESDDAPLEVHRVGTLGGLPCDIFDPRFCYVALGHIHRSYRVENSNAYYCGSPIPLSVKESKSQRWVNIINLNNKNFVQAAVEKVEIPLLRKIHEIKGTFDEVVQTLKNLTWETPLPPLLSVQVKVEFYIAGLESEMRKKMILFFPTQTPLLASVRQNLDLLINSEQKKEVSASLKDLSEEQVFLKMCATQNQTVDRNLLLAFRSLLFEENI